MENNKNLDLEKSIELINNSFFSEAINLLKNLIKQNNSDFRAYYLLGSSYLKLKKLDLAEINLKKAIELNNSLTSAYHNLGITFSLRENFQESNKLFLRVLELDSNNIETIIELGRNYELSKNYDNAKKYYLKALELDFKNKTANNLLGQMLINNGFHKDGIKYIQKSAGIIRFEEKNYKILE